LIFLTVVATSFSSSGEELQSTVKEVAKVCEIRCTDGYKELRRDVPLPECCAKADKFCQERKSWMTSCLHVDSNASE